MSDNATSAGNQQGSPLLLIKKHDPSETIRRIPHMNRELAMLLGILFTDGCVSRKWKNSWRIYFCSKSDALIQLFKDCMVRVFSLPAYRVRLGKTSNGYLKAVVNSKEIGTWLTENYGQFRTLKFKDGNLPIAKLPVAELISSGYVKDFLLAAFSCDGGISFYPAHKANKVVKRNFLIRTIFLSCAHLKLRDDYLKLLAELGIGARNVPGDNKIKMETESGIRKFAEKVGFFDEVEVTNHSKHWRGYTKNQVLELLVRSYGDAQYIYALPQFHLR